MGFAGLLVILGSTCFAHRDAVLPLHADGSITGLPRPYGPGRLDVMFSPDRHGRRIDSFALQLGKVNTRVPACAAGLLNTQSHGDIRITASWYHDESLLPYYLSIDFFDTGRDQGSSMNPGFSFLFNLRTGKLIQLMANVVLEPGRTMQSIPVDLQKRCSASDLAGFAQGAASPASAPGS
jgi:hypothetical protein